MTLLESSICASNLRLSEVPKPMHPWQLQKEQGDRDAPGLTSVKPPLSRSSGALQGGTMVITAADCSVSWWD